TGQAATDGGKRSGSGSAGAVARTAQEVAAERTDQLAVEVVVQANERPLHVGRVVHITDLVPVARSAEARVNVLVARLNTDLTGVVADMQVVGVVVFVGKTIGLVEAQLGNALGGFGVDAEATDLVESDIRSVEDYVAEGKSACGVGREV